MELRWCLVALPRQGKQHRGLLALAVQRPRGATAAVTAAAGSRLPTAAEPPWGSPEASSVAPQPLLQAAVAEAEMVQWVLLLPVLLVLLHVAAVAVAVAAVAAALT